MPMGERLISMTLGLIGAVVGGIAGYHLFFWIADQGYYALVLPGAAVGMGCGLLARHQSVARGIACALAALGLGLYTEWKFQPFVADNRFPYLVLHFYDLKPITLIMIGLGSALSYYLGKDAGFLWPRKGKPAAPTSGPGE
jgi:hypothetical protein